MKQILSIRVYSVGVYFKMFDSTLESILEKKLCILIVSVVDIKKNE